MQTQLAPEYQSSADALAAEAILRKCVHCGFCTATCPTYQLLGDELDGPRGRIYLIKQVLEGAMPTRKTQLHLDRCLTCRSCESTCPSGVQYGHLLDIGRKLVETKVPRPLGERALRWALKEGLTSALFAPAMTLGQQVRALLPLALRDKVPARQDAGLWPTREHRRQVLLLAGCVQPAMSPNINRATARVLDATGIQCLIAPKAACCGAIKFHLNDQDGGKTEMRANIDAWWPYIDGQSATPPVEAIISNASGCGVTVKEYGYLLRNEPAYAAKAARVSALTKDLSEYLPDISEKLRGRLKGKSPHPNPLPAGEGTNPSRPNPPAQSEGTTLSRSPRERAGVRALPRLAYHPPCSLQHGLQLRGGIERYLSELGFDIRIVGADAHLCCGSAGTYSVLNLGLSHQLRERKLGHLNATFGDLPPDVIVSANMGCITHLQSGTSTPVRHWIEVLDEALQQPL